MVYRKGDLKSWYMALRRDFVGYLKTRGVSLKVERIYVNRYSEVGGLYSFDKGSNVLKFDLRVLETDDDLTFMVAFGLTVERFLLFNLGKKEEPLIRVYNTESNAEYLGYLNQTYGGIYFEMQLNGEVWALFQGFTMFTFRLDEPIVVLQRKFKSKDLVLDVHYLLHQRYIYLLKRSLFSE